MTKTKVLFVCLGNICRSPLAEAIFKHKIKEKKLELSYEADSCGTSNYHIGDGPDHRTIKNAHKNGVRIDHHARQLTDRDLETFDFILAMDRSNYNNIFRLARAMEYNHKVLMMRQFDAEDEDAEVPDPYYGGERGFQEVFDILDRSIEGFITYLQSQDRSRKAG
ncbi:MAG TPA: low molecular weight protein-tyrosine-phosphatase [Cyclobacteriaceae bacterium]|nr:low molecular weight protein-tyrosine-phosphatase [Cyclobacteriaceae bacterium]